MSDASIAKQRDILLRLKVRVQLATSEVLVSIGSEDRRDFRIPAAFARRGKTLKLILDDGASEAREPDPVLLKLVAHAHAAQLAALGGGSEPLLSGYSQRYVFKLVRLAWLAPDIISAIVEGRHPTALNGRRLLRVANVPLGWNEQRNFFGFA